MTEIEFNEVFQIMGDSPEDMGIEPEDWIDE